MMLFIGLVAAVLFIVTLCLLAFRPEPAKPPPPSGKKTTSSARPPRPASPASAQAVGRAPGDPAPEDAKGPEDADRGDGGPERLRPDLPADFRSHDLVRHLDERGYATFKDLFFHPGSPRLREESTGELPVIAALLFDESESLFDIEGSSNGNAFLAKHRAEAVIEQLVAVYGVDRRQLRSRGRAAGTSNIARNRRVQIIRAEG
ncbi:MAG: hypothetical protein NXI24_13225 [bacterium]|nr:hypothetical protein [bacterium]